jgi:alginate O-acetyltransferase complex protein AlgI
MLFASFDFLIFFVPVLAAFWALRNHPVARVLLLLAASYFFYMASARPPAGELPPPWTFAGLLVFSTVLDYVASLQIHRAAPASASPDPAEASRAKRVRNTWLLASLIGNLGLLAYFKYVDFFIEATIDVIEAVLPGALGTTVAPTLAPILPIGISFYTFQSLSYTIDVWRERLTPEPSFRRFALFVVFFPQLVAGPIVRASEFLPQLHRPPNIRPDEIEWALFRIFKGLLKKVVLGDFIAVYFTDIVFDAPADFTSLENLLALYAFTLQIYADFAGYSDIAIGVARLLGFEIPENFDRPYQAVDVGEFWRRWHMTLSTWLRDYLFFPLGGSRGSKARTYFNLWLTMFLVGMWHGASWNFVIYSNVQGGAMLFNRWNRLRERSRARALVLWLGVLPVFAALIYGFGFAVLELPAAKAGRLAAFAAAVFALIVALPQPVRHGEREGRSVWARLILPLHVLLTFHFSTLSRVFFRAEDLPKAKAMIAKLLELEPRGVREGLFRIQALHDWLREVASPGRWWFGLADAFAEWGLLILLVLGTAYHFTPHRWIDENFKDWFCRLPGPVLGLLYAGLCLLILHLLDGPRANIYFAF